MTNVSAELVEKAAEALWRLVATKDLGHREPYPYSRLASVTVADLRDYLRAAIESVLPDIERPWQEKIEQLDRHLDEFADENITLTAQLDERDREIERLTVERADDGGPVPVSIKGRVALAQGLSAGIQFTDAERAALLKSADGRVLTSAELDARGSARRKLEQGQ